MTKSSLSRRDVSYHSYIKFSMHSSTPGGNGNLTELTEYVCANIGQKKSHRLQSGAKDLRSTSDFFGTS